MVRQPEGKYETHFTPSSGSGQSIGVEMASVVRKLNFLVSNIDVWELKIAHKTGEGEWRCV